MLPSLPARVAREEAALAASLARERASTLPPGPQRDGVRLALLPALLQYLLDRGAMTTEHVGYQMMERLCLGAIGRENLYPTSRYDNLRDYSQALRFHGGTAVLHLLHGQGYAGAAPTVGAMGRAVGPGTITATEYLARHNTGIFHPDTVKRSLCTKKNLSRRKFGAFGSGGTTFRHFSSWDFSGKHVENVREAPAE